VHRRRLTEFGRALLVGRVLAEGWSATAAAEASGVSRATAYKWLGRFREEGPAGLSDRSSRPHRVRRTAAEVVDQIVELRRTCKLGPHRMAGLVGVARSTCYAVLRREGLHRLDWLDRPTGLRIRRYERERPGELVHVDVKKLGRIRVGGGHRMLGRSTARRGLRHQPIGYDFVHACVDDHSRLAYAEIHADERGDTCAAFVRRAGAFFAEHGIQVERVLTDNAKNYRLSKVFQAAVAELGASQRFTRPYRPQTNGKAERFNRTLLEEWAYARLYTSNAERSALLPGWLHMYNHHRSHTALGGHSPIERVNNLPGNYT
jgi:transposase InsO family protein